MSDTKTPAEPPPLTMGAARASAEDLIRTLGKAHTSWVLANRTEGNTLAHVATYIAFRALARAFDLSDKLEDPEAIGQLNALADNIEFITSPVEDPPKVFA